MGTDPLGRPIPEGGIYDPSTQRPAPSGQLIRDQFPGNQIPLTRLDPVALKIQGLIPNPNLSAGVINNAAFPFPSTRHTEIPAFKLDHSLSTKAKLSYYWSETITASQLSSTLGGADGLPEPIDPEIGTFIHSRVQRGNFEYSLSPTLLFHFGAGYFNDRFADDPVVTNYNPEQDLGLSGVPLNRLFPNLTGLCPAGTSNGTTTTTCGGQGGMTTMGTATNRHRTYQKPTFNTSMTWVNGNHTYKAGAELRLEIAFANLYSGTNGSFGFSTNETALPYTNSSSLGGGTMGFGYASFLLGAVDSVKVAPIDTMRLGKHSIGLFLQDTWKVTRKLTLDYGVRYDYQTYLKESQGRFSQFAPLVPNTAAGGELGAVEYEGFGNTPLGTARCNCNFSSNYPFAIGPRLGVAYHVTPKTVIRGGWGLIYASTGDVQQADQGALSQPAAALAPSFGQPVMTLANGVPFAPPPFPNYNPSQYPQTGYTGTQAPPVWYDQNAGRPARQDEWSVGVQREIARDLAVEANYVGNRGAWWGAPGLIDVNALTPQRIAAAGLNLNNPADVTLLSSTLNSALAISRGFGKPPFAGFPGTLTVAQSLRPFPQFSSITPLFAPDGNTWYDSLQAKATQRFSHGLQFTTLFTWAKQFSTAAPLNPGAGTTGGVVVNDVDNRMQNKYLSPYDQPLALTISGGYTTPKIKTNKIVSWVARDWQINALMAYASGLPILAPVAQNNLNTVLLRNNTGSQTSYADRVPGVPLFTENLNCHCFDPNKVFALNPAAWTQPGPGQWGTSSAYYSDYRQARHPNENLGVGRRFPIRERVQLNIRIEFSDIFNRAAMPVPTSTNAAATQVRNAAGVPTAGFGFIATGNEGAVSNVQLPTSRQGTLVARITF